MGTQRVLIIPNDCCEALVGKTLEALWGVERKKGVKVEWICFLFFLFFV
jgi:hypothetical protein